MYSDMMEGGALDFLVPMYSRLQMAAGAAF